MTMSYEQRQNYACKVCGNYPDKDGNLEHGRGCYVVDADGGGITFVEEVMDAAAPARPVFSPTMIAGEQLWKYDFVVIGKDGLVYRYRGDKP